MWGVSLDQTNSKTVPIHDQYCTFPFENVEVNSDGKLYFCCSSWQNKPFGDYESHTISKEWNSVNAQDIRASIIDGSYKYCNKEICPYLQGRSLKKFSDLSEEQRTYFTEKKVIIEKPPINLILNYDQSCNLACESCRLEKISYNADSPEYKKLLNSYGIE